ncbi:MAG: guanylate kinase [Thermoflexales bacterium]|nr:guanylate kinase [Thermoflexales bacterium]
MSAEWHDASFSPLLIVIAGLSGAGKDSVITALKRRQHPFHFVITATDRPPRPHEMDGLDYIFVSTARFLEMIAQDELLEYAVVYGQHKGVPKAQVRQALASGLDVVMRLDVQGAKTIRRLAPEAILVFITTASEEELVARLQRRQTDSAEALALRVATAREELAQVDAFDYVIVNRQNELESAVDDVMSIIRAEHCRAVPRKVAL